MSWRSSAIATLRPLTYLVPPAVSRRVKERAETFFWKAELERYARWYDGEPLYGYPGPLPQERVTGHSPQVDAAMTFLRVVQFPRYMTALQLGAEDLRGRRVLDVGCGPFANLLAFEGCERHGVDPLADRYREIGFPLDAWIEEGFAYHRAEAEAMPFEDAHFDAVVSVNAVDHVDDFGAVAREIRRVLRPGGLLRLQVNYHPPTVTEPVSLDDATMQEHYGWAGGLRKLHDTAHVEAGERLTLWSGEGAHAS